LFLCISSLFTLLNFAESIRISAQIIIRAPSIVSRSCRKAVERISVELKGGVSDEDNNVPVPNDRVEKESNRNI
jgi:hypothetical protein